MSMAVNINRVLNYTVFIVLSIILACLIVLTPADAIYQCYVTKRLTNIFIITGGYVATFALAALIYATRIYTNRSVLAGIPKAWIPIEKEDVGKSVRRLVKGGLVRSAVIAFQARPRDISAANTAAAPAARYTDAVGRGEEDEVGGDYDNDEATALLSIDPANPPWGTIEHPGRSAPSCVDLPNLSYRDVILELPHLIEAKAVSLAPPDPISTARRRALTAAHHPYPYQIGEEEDLEEEAIPDTRVVEILRRPGSMCLREYILHLTGLGVVNPPEIGGSFLALYERARFSGRELYETEFRELMHVFAEVLRGMRFEDLRVLQDIRGEGDTQDNTESIIGPSDEEGETDSVEDDDYHYASRRDNDVGDARGRRRSGALRPGGWSRGPPRTPSMQSLRPVRSNISRSSAGSVIRLVDARGPSDLPYAIGR